MQSLEREPFLVRNLRPDDLEAVIRIDAKVTGRERSEYYRIKLAQNLAETGVKISLAAEDDDCLVGFLLARVYYGEFGSPEPAAVLEMMAVDPGFQGRGVGAALLRQLKTNLFGLGVNRLQTEVSWNNQVLMTFFHRQGFQPSHRLCLDLEIEPIP